MPTPFLKNKYNRVKYLNKKILLFENLLPENMKQKVIGYKHNAFNFDDQIQDFWNNY